MDGEVQGRAVDLKGRFRPAGQGEHVTLGGRGIATAVARIAIVVSLAACWFMRRPRD